MSTEIETAEQKAALLQLAVWGETVVYIPAVGAERGIKAIVERNGIGRVAGTKQGTGPELAISVANSISDGISSAEFKKNQDKIRLAVNFGETPQDRLLVKILDQDAGMLVLEVR
jgi:hypothetical protein